MASATPPDDLANQLSEFELSPTVKPLTSFTLFPNLPIELRLKIWKYALPRPPSRERRVVQVFARVSTTLKTRDYSRFILEDNIHSAGIREVGMLGANWESRAVYLKTFPFSLRTVKKGLIQYGSEEIIYISNMESLMANRYVRTAIRDHHQLEHLFSTCQIVAFPIFCFFRYARLSSFPAYGYGDLLWNFSNLRGVAGILDWEWYKFAAEDEVEAREWFREGWWHELSHLEMMLRKHRLWRRRGVPGFALLGVNGLLQGGRKCTEANCFTKG